MPYKDYFRAMEKLNETALTLSSDEVKRFSESDFFWANQRINHIQRSKLPKIKCGDILQFDFGKNLDPEMSYEHRGIVIGKQGRFLYVLPIFSYDPLKHTSVYHPIDSPQATATMYLLKASEYPFLDHDSVIKLNDLKSVSYARIKYSHKACIVDTSDVYKTIEYLAFSKCFPKMAYELSVLRKRNAELEEMVKDFELATVSE